MINISQQRAGIGFWTCHQISYSIHTKKIPNTKINSRIEGVAIIRKTKDLSFSLGVFLLLIISSGDVELNPGPKTGNQLKDDLCIYYYISLHIY